MDGLADILGGIFEPRPETSNKQQEDEVTESSTLVRIRVSPVSSDKAQDANKEGIMNAMSELERELILRGESLYWVISNLVINDQMTLKTFIL
jgi:hypothetical protein